MKALSSPEEAARLEALRQYAILDTAAEQAFDDLARLAAYVCKAPAALISFVDADRVWFKSKVGLNITEHPRDEAFCARAILQPDFLSSATRQGTSTAQSIRS